MNKIKKITISVALSLLILVVFNYICFKVVKATYISAFILLEDVAKGDKLTKDKISEVKIKKDLNLNKIESNSLKTPSLEGFVCKYNIVKGQLITNSVLIAESEYLSVQNGYENVSIPINNSTNILGYQVKKGDGINIYYTAKLKDVSKISEAYTKVYTTSSQEGNVTFKLYDNVQVIATYDNSGKQTKSGEPTNQVIIKVKKEDSIVISALKGQGVFDISLVN